MTKEILSRAADIVEREIECAEVTSKYAALDTKNIPVARNLAAWLRYEAERFRVDAGTRIFYADPANTHPGVQLAQEIISRSGVSSE